MAFDQSSSGPRPPTLAKATHGSPQLRRFASNAVWSILSIVVSLVAGLLMSPYLIRKLGEDGYGIWLLAFSINGYYTVLDFGFRSAVINSTAKASVSKDHHTINGVLSTAIAYTAAISILLLGVIVVFVAPRSAQLLGVSDRYADSFPLVFSLVGSGAVLSFSTNIVSGCLEGLQQYGSLRRLQTAALALRTVAYFLALWMGGKILALVLCTLGYWAALWVGYTLMLRHYFPELRLQWSLVSRSTLRDMAGYGVHTSVNTVAMIGQQQTPPIFISRSLPDAFIGYFSLPDRIVQVPIGMIRTIAEMLNPLAAEYIVQNKHEALGRIGRLGNRYGFILYAPIALLMLTWGPGIIHIWISQDYADNVGPLLPYFILSTWVALAGQGASQSLLFGIRAHKWCAWGLMGEAAIVTLASIFFLKGGLVVLARWMCGAMIANRCLLSAWALCRKLGLSFFSFLWSIYGVPTLLALPVYFLLRQFSLATPDKTWGLVFIAGVLACAYLLPAFFLCLDRDHRETVILQLRQTLRLGA
ncbi:MAG: oligosaccharide flippase family protein [Bryobacteraceae bacterium]